MQMTDAQVVTIAIAFIFPLAALIHSNGRITEAKETLRAEIGTLRVELNAQMQAFRTEMDTSRKELHSELETSRNELNQALKAGFDRMEAALKMHELEPGLLCYRFMPFSTICTHRKSRFR